MGCGPTSRAERDGRAVEVKEAALEQAPPVAAANRLTAAAVADDLREHRLDRPCPIKREWREQLAPALELPGRGCVARHGRLSSMSSWSASAAMSAISPSASVSLIAA